MKKLIIVFSLFFSIANAQQNCRNNALTPADFNNKYAQLSNLQGDRVKLNFCGELMQHKCLTSMQVKQFAMLFNNDNNRLQFAGQAFQHTVDPENFYDVYDAFKNFSTAFQLHDIIHETSIGGPPEVIINPVPDPTLVVTCTITPAEFEQVKSSINNESISSTRISITRQILSAKKCFTCSQVKEIVNMMSFESGKLEIAKYAYDFTIDRGNYYTIADAFSFSSSKEDLMRFIKDKN